MAEVINGKKFAEEITEKIKMETAKLMESHGVRPGLAVIVIGDDPASQIYVSSKNREAEKCGFSSITYRPEADICEDNLIHLIQELNGNPFIHGILVQLPLPDHIRTEAVIQAISPNKDVDGFHCINVGKLVTGAHDGFIPCTPAGSMIMIRRIHGDDLSGLDVVIVGRSNIVGKPIASLLLAANATITIAHSGTSELPDVVRSADILVVAIGRPEMIKGAWIKPGATVIDVGINRVPALKNSKKPTRLVGDVEFEMASIVAKNITPVPGGVGPMTIAMLMVNTLKAAYRSAGVVPPIFH
ncbi:MAG: methylenetetrahydrofolate dehydrogenase (NADP+) / methenyltetrahydrofolate cyclohydrolase [Candidatus Tokpelaia sp. JSC188]|nr:MAG: methylenetetrahydrofolate dehydrogenase (NADP+) / methenyltetrahydrofolate cyclohydrolase [Candidatus Tokpelaia sp. JSC188]